MSAESAWIGGVGAGTPPTAALVAGGEGEDPPPDGDVVLYRLDLTDTSNQPLPTDANGNYQVETGQTVRLHGYTRDIRHSTEVDWDVATEEGAPKGVFAAYMDVFYTNANLITVRYGETQQIEFVPVAGDPAPMISGSFTLTFDGETTAPITYSVFMEDMVPVIQQELEALTNVGPGNVEVTQVLGTKNSLRVRFVNELGEQDVPMLTVDRSQLNNCQDVTVSERFPANLGDEGTFKSSFTAVYPFINGLKAESQAPEDGQPSSGATLGSVGCFFEGYGYTNLSPTAEYEFFQVDLKAMAVGQIAFSGNLTEYLGGDTAQDPGTVTLTFPANPTAEAPKFEVDPEDVGFVQDFEHPLVLEILSSHLSVDIAAGAISEGGGSTTATVTRHGVDISQAVEVTLTSGDLSEALVPATVTIPANQASSAPFTITAVDDLFADGTQQVPITARGTGYVTGSAAVDVTDWGEVLLHGTASGDTFRFDAADPYVVTINGQSQTFNPAIDKVFDFRGSGGNDTISVVGNASIALAVLRPGTVDVTGTVTGLGYTLHGEGFEIIRSYSNTGAAAEVRLYDSAGDDTLTADGNANGARLVGTNVDLYAEGFAMTYAYATGGGADTTRLFDSAGNDTFTADGQANGARFQGAGFDLYAESFEQTYAYATNGGTDTARLFDSAGDDLFQGDGSANGVRFQGAGFDLYAESFEMTYGYAQRGGVDTARLLDSAGDDLFRADGKANGVRFQGTGFDLYAESFEQTYGYAQRGGVDTASLQDSAGNDLFLADGNANGARLQGTGIDLYAEGFEKTYAYATGGGSDTARLYDSAGDDTFSTDGAANGARLQGPGIDLYAEGFEQTYAYATNGGSDTASLLDAATDDTFTFDYPGARFQGPGFDAYAENFEVYYAYASRGGYDRTYLYDTDGNDALQGISNWYLLTTPYANVRGEGFDYVKATKDAGGTNTLDASATDYLFETLGWI